MSASTAMQEYLAEAYRLAYYQNGEPYISTSALASIKNVSAPAVTRMVQRLKEAGFLEHEPYRGVRLTPEGEREALAHIRRHRIVERFLCDVMGFGWHEVHDLADEVGAAASDALVERMNAMAHEPTRCAHGEPIPTAHGFMPRVIDEPLTEAATATAYVVSRVTTHDEDMLHYLGTLGLKPGMPFTLVDRAPFNGPLHIQVHGETHHIGYELAGVLRVCSAEDFDAV